MVIRALFLFLTFFFCTFLMGFSQNEKDTRTLDSLKNAFSLAEHDTTRCSILYEIGTHEDRYGNLDTSLVYFKKALEFAKIIDKPWIANCYRAVARAFGKEGTHLDSSRYYIDIAISHCKELKDTTELIKCLGVKSSIESVEENNEGAIKLIHEQLELINKSSSKSTEFYKILYVSTLHELGLLRFRMKQFKSALKVYHENLNLAQKIEDNYSRASQVSTALRALGAIHNRLEDYDSALHYSLKSKEIAEKNNFTRSLPFLYRNIGVIYGMMEQDEKATEYFLKTLEANKKAGTNNYTVYNNLIFNLIKIKRCKEALKYMYEYEAAIAFTKEPKQKKEFLTSKANLYSCLDKADSAFILMNQVLFLNDSIHEVNNNQRVIEMEAKYKSEENKRLIAEKEAQLAQEQLEKTWGGGFLVGLLVLATGGGLIIRRRSKQKQAQLELKREKAEAGRIAVQEKLDDTNSELHQKQNELKRTEAELNQNREELETVKEQVAARILSYYSAEVVREVEETVVLDSEEEQEYKEKLSAISLNGLSENTLLLVRKLVKYVERSKNSFAEKLTKNFAGKEEAALQLRESNLSHPAALALLEDLENCCGFMPHLRDNLRQRLGRLQFAQVLYVYAHYTGEQENTKTMALFWNYVERDDKKAGDHSAFHQRCKSLCATLGAEKQGDETWYAALKNKVQSLIDAPKLIHQLPSVRDAVATENVKAWVEENKETLQQSPKAFYREFKTSFEGDFSTLIEAFEGKLTEDRSARAVAYLFYAPDFKAKDTQALFGEKVSINTIRNDWTNFCKALAIEAQADETQKQAFFRYAKENWEV